MGRQNPPPSDFESTGTPGTPYPAPTPAGPSNRGETRSGAPAGFPTNPFGTTGTTGRSGVPGGGAVKVVRKPTAEEIRRRAYELYCARNGRGGSAEEDWLRAERELTAKFGG